VTAFTAADFSLTSLLFILFLKLGDQVLLLNHLEHLVWSKWLEIHVEFARSFSTGYLNLPAFSSPRLLTSWVSSLSWSFPFRFIRLQTFGRNLVDRCQDKHDNYLQVLMSCILPDNLLFCQTSLKFSFDWCKFVVDMRTHLGVERCDEMFFALKYLLDYSCNVWTPNQEVVDCDPSLKRFLWPLVIFFTKSVHERTQQSTSVKSQFTWFLDTLNII
jgi:hypothetical protein